MEHTQEKVQSAGSTVPAERTEEKVESQSSTPGNARAEKLHDEYRRKVWDRRGHDQTH